MSEEDKLSESEIDGEGMAPWENDGVENRDEDDEKDDERDFNSTEETVVPKFKKIWKDDKKRKLKEEHENLRKSVV